MKRLKELRKSRGVTQEELGEALGVSAMAISGYENAKRQPAFDIVNKIADYFGVTTDYLLERVEDENAHATPAQTDPQMAFGATLADGMSYEDLNPKGKAELYEYYQYLKQKYPKED